MGAVYDNDREPLPHACMEALRAHKLEL